LPLLTQAPWVFARGNHESCARSGQGWFRFIDYQAWDAQRTCNTVADYEAGDYSVPFAVSIGSEAQIIVFDSSADKKKNMAIYSQKPQIIRALINFNKDTNMLFLFVLKK